MCTELEAMLEEAESMRIIDKGFKLSPDKFDVGPGTSFSDGEQLVNVYLWAGERDPELKNGQPALTLGFNKESAAKLIYTMIAAARSHGWMDDDSE